MSAPKPLDYQTAKALHDFDILPDAASVRLPVVQALYACSHETVRRGVIAGRIPAPRKLSPRLTAWNVGELRRALAAA
jgi:predicted DNA-binding transcriptional regulator AlpA